MSYLFYLVFILSAHPAYSRWTFANILDASLLELRTKRQASCDEEIQIAEGESAVIQLRTELYNNTEFYKANEDYTWCVKTPKGNNMIITSEYFRVEQFEECAWDYVEIREQNLKNSKFCGRSPFTYITNGENIVIQFKSDVSYEDRGFKFNIDSVPVNTDESKCNSSIVGGEDSKIFNKEDVGASCFYRIEAPEDKVIELTLKMLGFGSASCEDESILIYRGLTNQGEPLRKICSDAIVERDLPFHVNTVFIEYRNSMGQEGNRFEMRYSFVDDTFTPAPTPSTTPSPVGGNNDCSGFYKDIKETSGEMIYKAPEYQDDKECVIVVRNTLLAQHVVQIHFNYFHIEDSENCTFDSLRILSGERNDSKPLEGPYCGKSLNGRTFITSGNSIRLEFRTDYSFALRGFEAVISFIPNKDCTCKGNLKCIRQGFEKRCIRASSCPHNTCMNGGTCLMPGSQQTCYCPTGYQGVDCSESDGSNVYNLHFVKAPTDRALKRKDSYIGECTVDKLESNEVEFQWTLNGIPIITDYSKATGFGTYEGGILKIDNFNDDLEGQYSCFAQTTSGIAEHTFELRLVDDCEVRIERGPQSEQKKIGDNAILQCRVDSRSKQVRWKKNGFIINTNNTTRFKLVGQYHYLQINEIQMTDAGTYQCEAEDKNGCYSYKEGELTVINVKPSNEFCGISIHDERLLPKISKGTAAAPNANPWHVTLKSTIGDQMTFCGGTLISQRFVLTAAHCVTEFKEWPPHNKQPFSPDNVKLIFGTTDCTGGTGTFRRPQKYILHPNFSKLTKLDSDIALIELDSAVEYNKAIRPICLEPAEYNDRVFLDLITSTRKSFGKVAGCGRTEGGWIKPELREITLPYVLREQCKEFIQEKKFNVTLTDNMICAGSIVAHVGDTCRGDSGGGLIMSTDTRSVQTGIVSYSIGECDRGNYGVYTNVGKFYSWIDGITNFTKEEVANFLDLS